MLVKLYDLPEKQDYPALREGISIRKALPPEKHLVVEWVKSNFNSHWASEVEQAYTNSPVSCILAVRDNSILGFACYEATAKGFFGPTGVAESARGQGLGKILLFEALHALRNMGYAYGIIGGIGPQKFYEQAVNAVPIEGSTSGIYKGMLK